MKLLASTLISSCLAAFAATTSLAATLSGHVKDESNKPLANVQVVIPAIQRGTKTNESGDFKIMDVPPGNYAVELRPVGYPSIVRNADLRSGAAALDVTVTGSPIALTPITISATPQPSSTLTTPASVSVVEGRELDRQRGQSVMSAIEDTPGVSLSQFGPNVIKPILRGLNSQRTVVAEDGIRNEVLQWGNEHAPEIDAMGVDRIEVLRGPNSLMYGSDALAGVISVTHQELPNSKLGAGPLSGKIVADVNSVNRSAGQAFLLSGAQGDWGWRTNLSQRQSGNYTTPLQGSVPNTGEHEVSGDGTVGVRKDWGDVAFNYGRMTKKVELQNVDAPGFPNVPLNDMEYQVLNHDKGSVRANVLTEPARFEFTAGYDRADRNEFDMPNAPDNTPTLHWIQHNFSAEAKAHHAPLGPFQGTIGVSGIHRWEQSLGVQHLTPPWSQSSIGEYIYEELPLGRFTFSAGLRGDQTHYNIRGDELVGIGLPGAPMIADQSLNYSSVSGALGAVYHVTDPLAFAVNAGRGFRNPVPFELFAYGEHEGEHVFNIGNPSLKPETSLNTDASIRWASPKFKGEVGVFRNLIQDYIFQTYTNLPDPSGSGLPVVQTSQANAEIRGVDFAATAAAVDWLTLKTSGSLVRGYNRNNDVSNPNHNLPHVPADWLKLGAEVHERRLGWLNNPYFGSDVRFVHAQRREGPNDIPTPGYALVGLRTGTEFLVANNRVTLDAGVDNLLNKGYIDYNSLVKFANIQNPGRNVYMKVGVPFGS